MGIKKPHIDTIRNSNLTTRANTITHDSLESLQKLNELTHIEHTTSHDNPHDTKEAIKALPMIPHILRDTHNTVAHNDPNHLKHYIANMKLKKPTIYVSCGDINGIGLEIILRSHHIVAQWCNPIYCISHELLTQASEILSIPMPKMELYELDSTNISIKSGIPTAQSGRYSFESFCAALQLSIDNHAGLVTLPISKYAWNLAGIPYAGHTHYLREKFHKNAIMMLGCEEMFVLLYTDHIPLREVVSHINKDSLQQFLHDVYVSLIAIQTPTMLHDGDSHKQEYVRKSDTVAHDYATIRHKMQAETVKKNSITAKMVARLLDTKDSHQLSAMTLSSSPTESHAIQQETNMPTYLVKKDSKTKDLQIAVLGVNPHAGDNGVLGNEDAVIQECIEYMNATLGQEIFIGPIPPDSAFIPSNRDKFTFFVAMYHDSGLAPLKALYFDRSINVSLNLPILRTSPDHGTGFDKAYKKDSHLTIQSYLESFYFIIAHHHI